MLSKRSKATSGGSALGFYAMQDLDDSKWYVFDINDHTVAGPYNSQQEAEREADRRQGGKSKSKALSNLIAAGCPRDVAEKAMKLVSKGYKEKQSAYKAGWDAAQSGKKSADNPYPPSSANSQLWSEGFVASKNGGNPPE